MASARILRKNGIIGRVAVCAILAGVGLGLGGCDQAEKTRQGIDQRAAEAQQSIESGTKPTTNSQAVAYDPLTVSNKVWSGNVALRMRRGMPLPARYEALRGVTIVSGDPMTIGDIADAISTQTGIPVRLSALTVGGGSGAAAASSPSSPIAAPNGLGASPTGNAGESGSSAGSGSAMPLSYEGSLSGLLERVSAYFGVSWRYDGAVIVISRYETRVFAVEALPGTQQINEGMQDDNSSSSSGGGSSGGGGGAVSSSSGGTSTSASTLTQNSKTTMDIKYWDELSLVLKSMIGSQGNVVISPSIGTVTVTTTPEVMATVSDYLAKENKRLGRQIAINVQIYSVNLGQSEDFNVAFNGFLKNLSKFSGMNYTSAAAPGLTNAGLVPTGGAPSNLGNLSLAILNGPADPTAHVGDIFNALSTIGDTTNVAQFPMTTLNNRPVSRRVGKDTAYISTVTQSTTTSTATTNTYSPTISTIHDGFSLQLTPRLLDDGRILLQYSLSLISVDTLGGTTFNTGSGNIPLSLPVTQNRIFVQQSMLRSGQTLMIGGVDQEILAQNKPSRSGR